MARNAQFELTLEPEIAGVCVLSADVRLVIWRDTPGAAISLEGLEVRGGGRWVEVPEGHAIDQLVSEWMNTFEGQARCAREIAESPAYVLAAE